MDDEREISILFAEIAVTEVSTWLVDSNVTFRVLPSHHDANPSNLVRLQPFRRIDLLATISSSEFRPWKKKPLGWIVTTTTDEGAI